MRTRRYDGERTAGSGLRDVALVLRLDHDLSIRTISQRLGVPRSTVGGWLRDVGETREWRECRLCGEHFTFVSSKKRFCDHRCAAKHLRVFGPASA
jgi:hypothetical protein